jgi:2-dehydropantoate 2-reductase
MMTMRICVFGAGSLGSALGGMLAQRHDVTLIGRRQHMNAARRQGLRLLGDVARTARVQTLESPANAETPDLLIISTKAYDTRSAIDACRRLVDDETMVLTLQNGLGNLELLRKWRGDKAFGGTTTMGAALVSPGIVRVSGLGQTTIGADVDFSGARDISRVFKSCGFCVQVKREVMREIWGKAIMNACINPTAAVLRVRNGRLLESKTTTRFMREVCRECEQVAVVSKVTLPIGAMYSRVRDVCADTANNISSMLQDVQKGKRTEIRQINGAFCSFGRARGVPTPLNDTLVAIVESL